MEAPAGRWNADLEALSEELRGYAVVYDPRAPQGYSIVMSLRRRA